MLTFKRNYEKVAGASGAGFAERSRGLQPHLERATLSICGLSADRDG